MQCELVVVNFISHVYSLCLFLLIIQINERRNSCCCYRRMEKPMAMINVIRDPIDHVISLYNASLTLESKSKRKLKQRPPVK